MSLNVLALIGNLGADPILTVFESGTQVCKFPIAVNSIKDNEDPMWVNIETWGKTAANCANYLHKGSKVAVNGSLKIESWTAQSGEKRTKVVCVAQNVEFLSSKVATGDGKGNNSAYERGIDASTEDLF